MKGASPFVFYVLCSLGVLTLVVSLWFLLSLGPVVDEAITYRYFVSKGWLESVSTYVRPNNHPLFSFAASFAVKLPINPFLAMRLVSFCAFIGCGALVYKILRLRCEINWSLAGVLLWSSSFAGLYYGILARGYGLLIFFFLLSFLQLLKLSEPNSSNRAWIILITSCTMGFFTIPTFLYPFLTILIFLLVKKWKTHRLRILYFSFSVGVLSVLLYVPIITNSGLGSLIDHQWIVQRRAENLSIENLYEFIVRIGIYFGPGFFLVLIFYTHRLIRIKERLGDWNTYALFLVVVPACLCVVTQTLPFARSLVYALPLISVFVVHELRQSKKEIGLPLIVVGSALSLCFSVLIISQVDNPAIIGYELRNKCLSLPKCDKVIAKEDNVYGGMLDFYSWYYNSGPRVWFMSDSGINTMLRKQEISYLLTDRLNNQQCLPIVKSGPISIFECK